jgi:hypothetical protein
LWFRTSKHSIIQSLHHECERPDELPMDFTISCECGEEVSVSEWAAGSQIECGCGSTVKVPSLARLRADAGLASMDVPVAIQVSHLLESGELPTNTCIACQSSSTDVIPLVADCEQVHVQESGGSFFLNVLGILIFGWWIFFLFGKKQTHIHGRETIIPVPASVCHDCQRRLFQSQSNPSLYVFATVFWAVIVFASFLFHWACGVVAVFCGIVLWRVFASNSAARKQQTIKETLGSIPIYRKVFETYPDALVVIQQAG